MNYRSIIESRYDRARWLALVNDIFGHNASLRQVAEPVTVDSNMAEEANYLGRIALPDGYQIAVYEVRLSDRVQVERNRAGIRNLLLTHWRGGGYAGAFMFCYRKNDAVLRFSYVSETWQFSEDGKYTKSSTDTRRYTYLLGEGHRSRTAVEQFEKLKASPLTLKDLTKAFSVEALSERFFDQYKKCYEDIVEYVTGKRMVKEGNKWVERVTGQPDKALMGAFSPFDNPEKAVRDYVKKLMGRLVFIQFLQKKGWMGASAGESWEDGDRDFLQHLYEGSSHKETFIDDVLEPLFDDINTQREGDMVSDLRVGSNIKVPYLNGGLFERDDCDRVDFPLPARFIGGILDFFAAYNFTIDENDPDDAEVGVDPEMLGRVFENLLEDNKDKGAFYTPKEIVRYMCRESLIAYLQTGVDDEPTREALRQFVDTHDVACINGALSPLAHQVDEELRNVKICDPAIGSGAFPMGLLRELFACRQAIEGISQETAVQIKSHIIQQNIYGVDIERGAVDIARLRFWLALIVDETTPAALPNLDFKIMQGNSLLEQYKGVDLSAATQRKKDGEVTLFDNLVDVKRKVVRNLLSAYFSCPDHQQKARMRQQIQQAVLDVMCEDNYKVDFTGIDISATSEFFLWHTWFADVFNRPSPCNGFDIVIGNPPYIQLQNNGGELAKLYSSCGYQTFARTGDIYCLFYERGTQLLRQGGHLCYITSNKWMRAGYGEKTRAFFAKNNPQLLIDFAGVKVFESATVDTNILLLQKADNAGHTLCAVANKKDGIQNMSLFVRQAASTSTFAGSDAWVILSPIEQSIRRKIEAVGTPLKDWDIQINYGIKTGCNEAFIISTAKREEILAACATEDERQRTAELIRPILRGRDIKRYAYEWAGLWLINTHNGVRGRIPRIRIEDYPAIKAHLDQFWTKIEARADQGDTPYNLRNCAYMEEFQRPKIVWGEISDKSKFAFDFNGDYVPEATTFLMTGEHIEYLLAALNSNVSEWLFSKTGTTTGVGTVRWKKYTIEQLLVACPDKAKMKDYLAAFEKLKNNEMSADEFNTFSNFFMNVSYGLTPDEIAYIESRED